MRNLKVNPPLLPPISSIVKTKICGNWWVSMVLMYLFTDPVLFLSYLHIVERHDLSLLHESPTTSVQFSSYLIELP